MQDDPYAQVLTTSQIWPAQTPEVPPRVKQRLHDFSVLMAELNHARYGNPAPDLQAPPAPAPPCIAPPPRDEQLEIQRLRGLAEEKDTEIQRLRAELEDARRQIQIKPTLQR